MMNNSRTRGARGYIDGIKKHEYMWAITLWVIVLVIYLTSRLENVPDYIIVLAILNCLPASKATVGIIMKFSYRSMDSTLAEQVENGSSHILVLYDLLLTSEKILMNVDSISIYGNTVCGYVSNKKTDRQQAEEYIRMILERNGYGKLTVKLFDEFKQYLTRVEGLNSIAQIEKKENVEHELAMGQLLMSQSM